MQDNILASLNSKLSANARMVAIKNKFKKGPQNLSNQMDRFGRQAFDKQRNLSQASLDLSASAHSMNDSSNASNGS